MPVFACFSAYIIKPCECTYVRTYACMYDCTYACMYDCTYACMYACGSISPLVFLHEELGGKCFERYVLSSNRGMLCFSTSFFLCY